MAAFIDSNLGKDSRVHGYMDYKPGAVRTHCTPAVLTQSVVAQSVVRHKCCQGYRSKKGTGIKYGFPSFP